MAGVLLSEVCSVLDPHVGSVLTPELAARIAAQFMDIVLGEPLDLSTVEPSASGSYVFAAERAVHCLDALHKLHADHWDETEEARAGLPFNPDYEWVLAEEAAGRYLQMTMRHNGELVGNFALCLARSHHTRTVVANEDTMFILPDHRKGRAFLRFTQFGEEAARKFGARELRLSTKTANKVGEMLPRMGYTLVAHQFTKIL